MKNPFKIFDNFFIEIINRRMHSSFWDFLFFHITHLGGVTASVLYVVVPFLLGGKYRALAYQIVLALAISTLSAQILKRIFSRNRPYWILKNLHTFGIDLSDYSFPSGHSTASFTVAVIVGLNYPGLNVVVLVLAGFVAISRIYLGVHYPTDVLAGVLLGTLSSLFVYNYLI
ncbi:phosphatase PAP2 family protein [Peptoniphilus equinus]|uniref:Phosphatase PAP2 family protein n=1 Tax=Peptoniphilus equinus TaxID=3016343 RepID=A0ABY7QSN7_9FIRM|nr:phosphatase PAP2 family protein [Peptoniphilus equinus]WBW49481.1 phosphatase PAP2 family protein [Peptoniphilus equinus]